MENIIFLDIDGVLNDNKIKFSIESIDVLKSLIHKYKAKIVIISSLQANGTTKRRNKISDIFKQYNIYDIDFIDPNFKGEMYKIKIPARVIGIVDYLKENKDCNYVILDDEYFNDYKLLCLNYYRTNMHKGLKKNDLYKISLKNPNLNNFKYLNYSYRDLGNYEQVTNNLIKVLKKIKL